MNREFTKRKTFWPLKSSQDIYGCWQELRKIPLKKYNTHVLKPALTSILVMLSWLDYKLIQLLRVGNIYQLKMRVIFNTAVSLFRAHPRYNEKRCLHNDYIVQGPLRETETILGILNIHKQWIQTFEGTTRKNCRKTAWWCKELCQQKWTLVGVTCLKKL